MAICGLSLAWNVICFTRLVAEGAAGCGSKRINMSSKTSMPLYHWDILTYSLSSDGGALWPAASYLPAIFVRRKTRLVTCRLKMSNYWSQHSEGHSLMVQEVFKNSVLDMTTNVMGIEYCFRKLYIVTLETRVSWKEVSLEKSREFFMV